MGFRKTHSTIDALAELTEKIRRIKVETVNFLLELKKAFDTFDHQILLYKMQLHGIRHTALKWFKSDLSERSQKNTKMGVSSNWLNVNCGVPQGSILGPLLFLIYINDLPNVCSQNDIYLFADDTNICGLNCSSEEIQADLLKITKWLNANKVKLNISKTFQLNNKTSASSHQFKIEYHYVVMKNEWKYLGITVDSKFSYRSHIKLVFTRLSGQCGVISKLRHFVPRVPVT